MATRHAIATMDAEARNRMRLVSGRLVKRLGLPEPLPPVYERNPEIRAIRELEAHVAFLESLDEALKAKGFSAAAESKSDAMSPSAESQQEPPATSDKPKKSGT